MLLDSNIVIYAALPAHAELRQLAFQGGAASAISRVEVLGFHLLTPQERVEFDAIFAGMVVLPVSSPIIERAVQVRHLRKMSIGDAIIAATALEYGLTLATNNEADFKGIPGLRIHNPLKP
jgi:predicted nucleic acid-binding protein